MPKRKVFIAYHHASEQRVVDEFIATFSEEYDVFTDKSLERAADSDDVDYLNKVCRDAIDGTSVTVVMIGRQTGCRNSSIGKFATRFTVSTVWLRFRGLA